MFNHSSVDLEILKERAHNLRWASVPAGIIPLTAADPDFPSAPEIAEAICKFTRDRYFCYGHPEGLPEFKASMAGYFQKKRLVPTSPDLIFPVDSAAFGIYLTCRAFLSPGNEAIIFDPVDFLFRYSIESVGGKAVSFAIPAGPAAVDFDQLEKLINKNTRLLCLCNPLNPTGKVFTKEELTRFGEIACKYNLTILSDEIWSDIVFLPNVFTSIASINEEIRNRTVTVTGFSKSYGLAGLRIGAVMASNENTYKKLIEASLHNSTIHGANLISQVAASTALNECEYWLTNFVKHLHSMRDLCVSELNSIPGFKCIAPEGCYVAFVDIKETKKSSKEIQELLMTQAKVAVVPGLKQWFGEGADGYIRMSFATSEIILRDALSRIKNTINYI
jgi:aminotransferase